jgi:hypothetical protein
VNPFERLALERIEEAVRKGELDDLPGRGQPIDLSDYFSVPDERRLAYGMLRNAGVLPTEAQLLGEIHELEMQRERCTDPRDRQRFNRVIEEKRVSYRLLVERYRSRSRRRGSSER